MEPSKEADIVRRKGESLQIERMYERAIICYNRATKLDPKGPNAYFKNSHALRELGKKEEAIDYCQQVIIRDPSYRNAYFLKGIALEDLARNQEAVDC